MIRIESIKPEWKVSDKKTLELEKSLFNSHGNELKLAGIPAAR